MKLEVVKRCPLKSQCEEILDGKIYRCEFLIDLDGTNPNTGETIKETGCAIRWVPILLVENSQQQRSTGAAIESFRNEMVNSNTQILLGAAPKSQLLGGSN